MSVTVMIPGCSEDQVKGSREYQEDTSINDIVGEWKIAGVFDGHGGGETSAWLMHNYISKLKDFIPTDLSIKNKTVITDGIKAAYKSIDSVLRFKIPEISGGDDSGSTAVVAIWNQRILILINLGDSRGVVFTGDGAILGETKDHKPNDPSEKKRIASAGGEVTAGPGLPRVNGMYAVSRAFGDFTCKDEKGDLDKSPMSWEPDITFVNLDTIEANVTCYLILASDGVWDEYETTMLRANKAKIVPQTMVTQSLVDKANELRRSSSVKTNPATSLINVYTNYNDNATVVWCDILGDAIDIPSITRENEEFEDEVFSDDEGTNQEYLVSGSIVSKEMKEMKNICPEERSQISNWLQTRLKNYLYILTAISINVNRELNVEDVNVVIVDIYDDPSFGNKNIIADSSYATDSYRDLMRRWKTERSSQVDQHIFTSIWLLSVLITRGMRNHVVLGTDTLTSITPFKKYLRIQRENLVHPYREMLSKEADKIGLETAELALIKAFKKIDSSLKKLFGNSREDQLKRIVLSLFVLLNEQYKFNNKLNRLTKGDPDASRTEHIAKKYNIEKEMLIAVDKTDILESTTETVMLADAIEQFQKFKGRDKKYFSNKFIVMSLPSEYCEYCKKQKVVANDKIKNKQESVVWEPEEIDFDEDFNH